MQGRYFNARYLTGYNYYIKYKNIQKNMEKVNLSIISHFFIHRCMLHYSKMGCNGRSILLPRHVPQNGTQIQWEHGRPSREVPLCCMLGRDYHRLPNVPWKTYVQWKRKCLSLRRKIHDWTIKIKNKNKLKYENYWSLIDYYIFINHKTTSMKYYSCIYLF